MTLWSTALLLLLPALVKGQSERPTYSSCTIPKDYEKQLNIIPVPRDNTVQHGQTITVLCRTSGYTFMNHMYSVCYTVHLDSTF